MYIAPFLEIVHLYMFYVHVLKSPFLFLRFFLDLETIKFRIKIKKITFFFSLEFSFFMF